VVAFAWKLIDSARCVVWFGKSITRDVMESDKISELLRLFKEFASSYLLTPKGQQLLARYDEAQRQGCQNFKAAITAAENGEDVSELVLLKLLPHTESASNRQKGVWIHIAPAISGIEEWFQRSGWAEPCDWALIAKAILNFVRWCTEEPAQLSTACTEFSHLTYCRGFQSETLSPILSALQPREFLLINNRSMQVVNYFTDKCFSQDLTDYPRTNALGHQLIEEASEEIRKPGLTEIREVGLFYLFSHWLVTVKRYKFKTARFTINEEMYKQWPPMW